MIKYKKGDADDRPWGRWEVLDAGAGHVVKRITVNPGGILSLQRHAHRSEHWIVVAGTARVTVGETVADGAFDQRFYIPAGVWHRIENPGGQKMEFIEIQTGEILDEADIERRQDKYGR